MSVRSWYGLTLKQVVVRVLADRVASQAAAPFAIWREADTHSHSHVEEYWHDGIRHQLVCLEVLGVQMQSFRLW